MDIQKMQVQFATNMLELEMLWQEMNNGKLGRTTRHPNMAGGPQAGNPYASTGGNPGLPGPGQLNGFGPKPANNLPGATGR